MSKRRSATGLGALLAMAVLALAPATAQAEEVLHWYSNGKLLKEPESLPTKGTFTFELTSYGASVMCKVSATQTFSDPEGGGPGISEVTSFKLKSCHLTAGSLCPGGGIEVAARALPWDTHLVDEANFKDVQEGVSLQFSCKLGTNYGVFTGTLVPLVNPGYGGAHCVATPRQCMAFEYQGDTLSGESGTLVVTGLEKLKAYKHRPKLSVRQDEV